MIECIWCGRQWEWDWCQDTVTGLDSIRPFEHPNKPEFKLELFICECGGSLCVLTTEPKGSDLLTTAGEDQSSISQGAK